MALRKNDHTIGTRIIQISGLIAALILVLTLPSLFLQYAFFRLPASSPSFDCDDATLAMMDRLSRIGITATPLLGNVRETGETYLGSDHVWLLADMGGWSVPLDWGIIHLDRQHYEGFPLTYAELVHFVDQDRQNGQLPGSVP